MKKIITLLLVVSFLVSCSRSVTMQQAANSNFRSARSVR